METEAILLARTRAEEAAVGTCEKLRLMSCSVSATKDCATRLAASSAKPSPGFTCARKTDEHPSISVGVGAGQPKAERGWSHRNQLQAVLHHLLDQLAQPQAVGQVSRRGACVVALLPLPLAEDVCAGTRRGNGRRAHLCAGAGAAGRGLGCAPSFRPAGARFCDAAAGCGTHASI